MTVYMLYIARIYLAEVYWNLLEHQRADARSKHVGVMSAASTITY